MARPGTHADSILNRSAEQIHERQSVHFGERVPNGAFKAVVFAAMGDRQFLAWQLLEPRANEPPGNVFDDAPIVVAIQLAQADSAIIQIDFENALGQLIELHGPRCLSCHRQLVQRLIDAGAVDRSRLGGHDHFGGDDSDKTRHEWNLSRVLGGSTIITARTADDNARDWQTQLYVEKKFSIATRMRSAAWPSP